MYGAKSFSRILTLSALCMSLAQPTAVPTTTPTASETSATEPPFPSHYRHGIWEHMFGHAPFNANGWSAKKEAGTTYCEKDSTQIPVHTSLDLRASSIYELCAEPTGGPSATITAHSLPKNTQKSNFES